MSKSINLFTSKDDLEGDDVVLSDPRLQVLEDLGSGDGGIDSGVVGVGATVSPGHDSDEGAVLNGGQWATGISLASVTAGVGSANVAEGERERV